MPWLDQLEAYRVHQQPGIRIIPALRDSTKLDPPFLAIILENLVSAPAEIGGLEGQGGGFACVSWGGGLVRARS